MEFVTCIAVLFAYFVPALSNTEINSQTNKQFQGSAGVCVINDTIIVEPGKQHYLHDPCGLIHCHANGTAQIF